jgi:hypothetical protein
MSYKCEVRINTKGIKFSVWQQEGKVYQNGRFDLPEILVDYGDSVTGHRQADAYIFGMVELANILNK